MKQLPSRKGVRLTVSAVVLIIYLGLTACPAATDAAALREMLVKVKIDPAFPTACNITLSWNAVPPANGGTISYDIEKSTDGGVNYGAIINTVNLIWTDNNGGSGVPNYTNVLYRLRAKESAAGGPYYSTDYRYVDVFPPDVNAHDNYLANTDLCHLCHSAHQAAGPDIMTQNTATALCLTCHAGLTNSKYDVVNGYTKISGGNAKSLGGALAHIATQGDVWNGQGTSSAHKIDEVTAGAAPGGANLKQVMGCTTCHSAHYTGNYRMIIKSITVPTGAGIITTYPVSIMAGAAANNPAAGETPAYISGTSGLCRACHPDYHVPAGSGGSGTAPASLYGTPGTYRHAIGVPPSAYTKDSPAGLTTTLPLEGTAAERTANPRQDKLVCLTCHYAHGTTATDSTVSTVVSGDGSTTTSMMSTTLKRLNGMGVCEDCHKK